MTSADLPTNLHRALAHPTRARLLELLRVAGAPRDIEHLAARLDLHVNTVRAHLALLEEAGLVVSTRQHRDGPGRPRLLYRPTDRATDTDRGDGYRTLAQILSGYVAATAPDPAAAGRDAGIAWGRHLVDRPHPFARVDVEAAVAEVMGVLDGFGFAPQLEQRPIDDAIVHLHRCPFLEAAREHQDVVCSLHLGLLQGALAELGADVEATELLPFVEPDHCIAHLRVKP